ncbi:MAG: hypothetical protein MUC43_08880 [Pirellula sp.]|nr:hypothetical protein [Pirellula sp.]
MSRSITDPYLHASANGMACHFPFGAATRIQSNGLLMQLLQCFFILVAVELLIFVVKHYLSSNQLHIPSDLLSDSTQWGCGFTIAA